MFFCDSAQTSLHRIIICDELMSLKSLSWVKYMAAAGTRVLIAFYFRLQISFPVPVVVFAVNWRIVEFMEIWGFSISFATCQPGNRSEYIFM